MPLRYKKPRYSKKSYTKKTNKVAVYKKRAPITSTGIKRLIKSQLLKTTETKYSDYSMPKNELYHNVPMYLNISNTGLGLFPTQGDTENQRDGNVIYSKGYLFRWICGLKFDRLNTQLRVLIVSAPKGQSLAGYSDYMKNITGNALLDPVDYTKVKVHYQRFIKPKWVNPEGTANSGKELTLYGKIWLPIKERLTFQGTGNTNTQLRQYALIVMPYDTYGSLVTDNICWFQAFVRHSWKDV